MFALVIFIIFALFAAKVDANDCLLTGLFSVFGVTFIGLIDACVDGLHNILFIMNKFVYCFLRVLLLHNFIVVCIPLSHRLCSRVSDQECDRLRTYLGDAQFDRVHGVFLDEVE